MAETIACTVCNHVNKATDPRCQACGAKLEAFTSDAGEGQARRDHQDKFDWKWVGISLALYIPLGAIILVALPMAVPAFDPQGLRGLLISGAVWFLGGIGVGYLSPGRTFLEPSVGAAITAIPTVYWLESRADVYQASVLLYVSAAVMGVMATVLGSFTGERFQGETRR